MNNSHDLNKYEYLEYVPIGTCIFNQDFIILFWNKHIEFLTGVEKKDISVDIHDGVLTLKGERKYEDEVTEDRFFQIERIYGKFQRAFRLPEGTDHDKINADFKDGILKVTVPKVEEKKPKQITIH